MSDPVRVRILPAHAQGPAYPSDVADSLEVSREMPTDAAKQALLQGCSQACQVVERFLGHWPAEPVLQLQLQAVRPVPVLDLTN